MSSRKDKLDDLVFLDRIYAAANMMQASAKKINYLEAITDEKSL